MLNVHFFVLTPYCYSNQLTGSIQYLTKSLNFFSCYAKEFLTLPRNMINSIN